MAITVSEKPDSRTSTTGPNRTTELRYIVRGTADHSDAKAALEAATEPVYDGLRRRNCEVEPSFVDETNPDDCIWNGTVHYEVPGKRPDTGDTVFSFDTTGGTQHITQSIGTVGRYAPEGKSPGDHKGAIGATHDSVEGVDIFTPAFKVNATRYVADALVTPTYRGNLFSLTDRVNNADFTIWGFGNFNAGELLFLGAQGTQRASGEDWEIQFSFLASPNKTGITVGDIEDIEKKGWEYMWVRYADAEDGDAKAVLKRPEAAFVEQVYEYGDFAGLDPPEP